MAGRKLYVYAITTVPGLVKESFDGEGGFSAGECTVILAQTDGKKLTAKHFSEAISRINDLHGNG